MANDKKFIVLTLSFVWIAIICLVLIGMMAIIVGINKAIANASGPKFYYFWLIITTVSWVVDFTLFVPVMRKRTIFLFGEFKQYPVSDSQFKKLIHYSLVGKYYMVCPY
ncbi:MAG: hypothetical protein ABJ275_06480 [Maricaulaceae bacterium]